MVKLTDFRQNPVISMFADQPPTTRAFALKAAESRVTSDQQHPNLSFVIHELFSGC